jgi:hypothetical protein
MRFFTGLDKVIRVISKAEIKKMIESKALIELRGGKIRVKEAKEGFCSCHPTKIKAKLISKKRKKKILTNLIGGIFCFNNRTYLV